MNRFTTSGTVAAIRILLMLTLLISMTGTVIELFLLEHTEDAWQWAPIGLIGVAFLVLLWFAVDRGPASLNAFRGIMVLFLLSGAVGVLLHYRGNVEFELEMYPDLEGFRLFRDSMMGATPALAPGTMIQLGLIGLAWAFRHPAGQSKAVTNSHEEAET